MTFDHLDSIMLGPNPISDAKVIGDGISKDQYLEQPKGAKRGSPDYVLSGSDLMSFAECPHRWVNGYQEEGTAATEWGSLVDSFLMDRGSISERYIILPATYTNDKGEQKSWNWNANVCKAWRAENNACGLKEEVKNEVFFSAKGAAELILSDPQLAELFANSRKQVMLTGVYVDKETGIRVPVKSLLDLVPPADFLADFKTSNNAHPKAWARSVFQFNYHVQSSRHLDLWNAASGETRNDFRHIIQESFQPFEIGKRILSSEFIALGRSTYTKALKRYAKCLASGLWPNYEEEDGIRMVIDGYSVTEPDAWMIC